MLAVALAVGACGKDVDPDQALEEGLAQQQAGNLEAAAEQYQLVLDARPDDKFANYNLGVIEQADGRVQLAEGYYRAALDTDANFVPALFNLAILRTGAGATQEAIDLYLQVIEIQPGLRGGALQSRDPVPGGGEARPGRYAHQPGARTGSVPGRPADDRAGGARFTGARHPDALTFVAGPPRSVSLSRRRQQGHVRIIPFAGTCRG